MKYKPFSYTLFMITLSNLLSWTEFGQSKDESVNLIGYRLYAWPIRIDNSLPYLQAFWLVTFQFFCFLSVISEFNFKLSILFRCKVKIFGYLLRQTDVSFWDPSLSHLTLTFWQKNKSFEPVEQNWIFVTASEYGKNFYQFHFLQCCKICVSVKKDIFMKVRQAGPPN